MPPRERFAWVWMMTLFVVFLAYFTAVGMLETAQTDLSFLARIGMLAAALGTLAIVVGIDRLIAFLRGGEHTHGKPDERDRLIERRSTIVAYYVLMAGMIYVGCVMPFSVGGWDIVHASLRAIATAEIVGCGMVVYGYRRGWRV